MNLADDREWGESVRWAFGAAQNTAESGRAQSWWRRGNGGARPVPGRSA